jgi:hypothetical protein
MLVCRLDGCFGISRWSKYAVYLFSKSFRFYVVALYLIFYILFLLLAILSEEGPSLSGTFYEGRGKVGCHRSQNPMSRRKTCTVAATISTTAPTTITI